MNFKHGCKKMLKEFSCQIADLPQDLIINPEIHHNNKVPEVIRFCKEMIDQSRL